MPLTLLDRLAGKFPTASKQTLKRMVLAGRVRVNGQAATKLSQSLAEGDAVAVLDRAETESARQPAAARAASAARNGLAVVYEDADLLVVDKPAGLLTSTGPRERRPTLLAAVTEYLVGSGKGRPAARVGLIHRLDRDASGLLVFSTNDTSYRTLKAQFFRHEVERVYAAIVSGIPNPTAGRLDSRLTERADGTMRSTQEHAAGQRAVTDYQTIRTDPARRLALLRVTLQTGRKHQIRAHLSENGTPILGDPQYGADAPRESKSRRRTGADGAAGGGRLMLAAIRLALTHPRTGRRMPFQIPPPEEFARFFPDVAEAFAGVRGGPSPDQFEDPGPKDPA